MYNHRLTHNLLSQVGVRSIAALRMFLLHLLIPLCLVISGSALAQKEGKTSKQELKAITRKNLDDTTKRLCLDRFSDISSVRTLAPFATVSQMCGCVISETSFAVSDELAENLFWAQLDQKSYKKVSKQQADKTFENYTLRYNASLNGCVEIFIRRRR